MAGVVVPDDVIAEILAKLPVKSLLRFNCVCKTWYSVISDPQFSNNLHRMRPCFLICANPRKFSTITIEPLVTIKNMAPTPLSLPWETEPDDYYRSNLLLGSCNGLVCVDLKSKSSPDRSGMTIWNPSTRKFRRVPRPGCYSFHDGLSTYAWFGYDELIDDYKLVWLNCSGLRCPPKVTELDVFTLKSNTWRRPPVDHMAVRGIHYSSKGEDGLSPKSIGVLSNGAIHWITNYFPRRGGTDSCILALNLATEKFRLLKFSHVPLGCTALVGGSLLGGCLCVCSFAYENGYGVRDLWAMKEYGVESSWTKLLSIPLTFDRPGPDFHYLTFYPSLFSSKEIVAMCNGACELSGRVVKLRVEGAKKRVAKKRRAKKRVVKLRVEGAKKVRFEETLLCVPRYPSRDNASHIYPSRDNATNRDNVVLHMEESLVSLSANKVIN